VGEIRSSCGGHRNPQWRIVSETIWNHCGSSLTRGDIPGTGRWHHRVESARIELVHLASYDLRPRERQIVDVHDSWVRRIWLRLAATGSVAPYIEQFVVPELRPGDFVVMDNLSAHKRASIGALIAGAGAELVYLPPYSPDLNPIEMIWSKVKSVLRTLAARTFEALEEAIVIALRAVSPTDATNCIRHAGYAVPSK
jgi:transposase